MARCRDTRTGLQWQMDKKLKALSEGAGTILHLTPVKATKHPADLNSELEEGGPERVSSEDNDVDITSNLESANDKTAVWGFSTHWL